jgi:hypothetical protein
MLSSSSSSSSIKTITVIKLYYIKADDDVL